MSIKSRMDKLQYVHTMEYSMAMRTIDVYNGMDEFHKYNDEQEKPDTKEYIQYDFIYMKSQYDKTYL